MQPKCCHYACSLSQVIMTYILPPCRCWQVAYYVEALPAFPSMKLPTCTGKPDLSILSLKHASQAVTGTQVVYGKRQPHPRPGTI